MGGTQPPKNRTFAAGLVTGMLFVASAVIFNRMACDPVIYSAATNGLRLRADVEGDPSACVKAAYPMVGPDSSYHYMKALPPPAECKVQGFTIEELEPQLNFRRPWTLGYVRDVESKIHVLPYMRASQDASLRRRQRRVYLDLGGRTFESSVKWFMHWYPLDFSEIHVFEAIPNMFKMPSFKGYGFPDLLTTIDQTSRVAHWGELPLPDWAISRVKLHNNFVTTEDKIVPISSKWYNGTVRSVNITKFILDDLKLTEDDAVIVKMDIEGAEWDVLPAWLNVKGMEKIIDEIWVEIHYKSRTMAKFHWMQWQHSREEAYELLQDMRKRGFFIHPWP